MTPDRRLDEARARDAADPAPARDRFVLPKDDSDSGEPELAFLAGNSLGPPTTSAADDVRREMEDWSALAVEAHLGARRPWSRYDELLRDPMARVVGARPEEVVAMNSLTVNLHLLLVSFFTPTSTRNRIVIERDAFPSDQYAVASHLASRGLDPSESLVRLAPRAGERLLRTDDVLEYLERESERVAVLLLGGVNYLTGQCLDLAAITSDARARGVTVGWDLAHAAGNVPLELHDWAPDFAAWCTYKYLSGGPGSVGAAFVHARHLGEDHLARLAGWWGTDPAVRFELRPQIDPRPTADAWAISNPPILSMAPLVSSLQVFDDVSMPTCRERSVRLTGHLAALLADAGLAVITPSDPAARGCQLSVRVPGDPTAVVAALRSSGVVADARRPDVVRLAPMPLYSTYVDVARAVLALEEACR